MRKSIYIFIAFVLSLRFWDISFIVTKLPPDVILVFTWAWIMFGVFYFNADTKRLKSLNSFKYNKVLVYIFLGIVISMFSALYFGKQALMITLFSQRTIYSFIFLPAILFIQPTEKDIINALRLVTGITMIVWVIVHINPGFVYIDESMLDKVVVEKETLTTKLAFYVNGIYFVIFYAYYKMGEYIKRFTWDDFIEASLVVFFILLYQNRSMILMIAPIYVYTLFKFRSEYKSTIIAVLSILLVLVVIFTSDIWLLLIHNTQKDLNEPGYNRWLAVYYYFGHYSPNWFCYVFGNGYPSGGKSPLGNLMWANFAKGIYTSDLGMVGMWVDFGIIPLIGIYSVVINVLRKRIFPLYLKFICLHVLLVPTIFHFWSNPCISFFVVIFYLYAYYTERNKKIIQYARNNNS